MIFQQFNQKINKNHRRNHFLNLKSENVKVKRSTKEKEFLLLASNFSIKRVHCQYSSSQDNIKSYILVRKKSPNEKLNLASIGLFHKNIKKNQGFSPNSIFNQRPPQNSSIANKLANSGTLNSNASKQAIDFPMIGDFIRMDMRSSSRQEQRIKIPKFNAEPGINSQNIIKPADDINLSNKVNNRINLEDDIDFDMPQNNVPFEDEMASIKKVRENTNLTPNANSKTKINFSNKKFSCSNIIINSKKNDYGNPFAASENLRELSQLSKINMKLKEINDKITNNENERYNLKEDERNFNSKSTKILKSIIMVKKEYMKSPREINRNVVIIDSRKDNYDKLERALRSDKFVDKIVEKIEKNRLEKERERIERLSEKVGIEKNKLIFDNEKRGNNNEKTDREKLEKLEKLEKERTLLEKEKIRLQIKGEKERLNTLNTNDQLKDSSTVKESGNYIETIKEAPEDGILAINNANDNKDGNNLISLEQPKDVKDASPEKIRSSFLRNTRVFRNNSLIQGKIEKLISPLKLEVNAISNVSRNKTNKMLKEIVPKNKQLFYIIKPGNNQDFVKKLMAHRYYWREANSTNTTLYNFKWQPTKGGIEYNILNSKSAVKKMVNHFEFDPEISNKKTMFINMLEYCNKKELNPFDFLPLTVIINFNQCNDNLKNFEILFENIKNYLPDEIKKRKELSEGDIQKSNEYTSYSSLFKIENINNTYENTMIKINDSYYTGKNMWIIKPPNMWGGRCIKVCDSYADIEQSIKKSFEVIQQSLKGEDEEMNQDEIIKLNSSCLLIQKYVEAPLLYQKRKFDIRMWVLITHKMEVYIFKEGHLKATSEEFSLDTNNKFVHITNYSLQKHNNNFEKYEEGNEISFKDFQLHLDSIDSKIDVKRDIYPKMKEIIFHSTSAVTNKLNRTDRQFCYLVLGYDFMIDCSMSA